MSEIKNNEQTLKVRREYYKNGGQITKIKLKNTIRDIGRKSFEKQRKLIKGG